MESEPHGLPVHEVNKARLEFLLDGVFAIAMTILVLEVKVPELADRSSARELLVQLAHHGRIFFSYVITFVVLGVIWYRHHVLYRCLRKVTRPIYALHIVLMAAAAFFPFCAALLGRYPGNPATYPVYLGCIWVCVMAMFLIWWSAVRQGALEPSLDEAEVRALLRRHRQAAIRLAVLLALYTTLLIVRG